MTYNTDIQVLESIGQFDETNITQILSKWNEINTLSKQLEKAEVYLKNKIRVYMKERSWDRYVDKDTKINITINHLTRESVDLKNLKIILTPIQYAQIINTTSYERMDIITPDARERMKKFIKINKNERR